MPYTAAVAYPSTGAGDHASARALAATAPAADATTRANFTTNTTRRKIQLQPAATNTASATPGAATNFGWHVLKTEMNRTANLPARAVIPAGVWTFNVAFTTEQADAAGAAAVIEAHVYRRKADGTYDTLFNAASPGVSVALDGAKTALVTSAAQPAYVFETDDTVHVELWVAAQGVAITGNIYTLNIGTGTKANLPAGVASNYPRTIAPVSMTGVASTGPETVGVRREVTAATSTAMARYAVLGQAPGADPGAGTGRTIAGVVRDGAGVPVVGATVVLVRESDHFKVAETTSAADGTYTFARSATDTTTYFVVGHKPGEATMHGTSRRQLVPA